MGKELIAFNGPARAWKKAGDPAWGDAKNPTFYAAAHSKADLRRLISEYCGRTPSANEINTYWHEGSWGRKMDDVVPARGLWLDPDHFSNAAVVQVYAAEASTIPKKAPEKPKEPRKRFTGYAHAQAVVKGRKQRLKAEEEAQEKLPDGH
ncbi:hypothetical protein HNP46_000399 [Pseudomonas nitritireducens]|uniref:Uncharacterized protein n=1 Tax=Pseudomonas nitroreducens TaxID=46680 RepID=A0A7W7KGA8_PSENT|nr:hypothetical protein [Pseudomonas nitritireducens]MBB4861588.1 hypothetical protein [Pseudomonas nitritireducens]